MSALLSAFSTHVLKREGQLPCAGGKVVEEVVEVVEEVVEEVVVVEVVEVEVVEEVVVGGGGELTCPRRSSVRRAG